ncbi:MAG: cation transporter, partial [Pseudanabaena sp. CAN_BIN31]|nr:cation transporter [Pseudanabaena sp. CAN_BIN31]
MTATQSITTVKPISQSNSLALAIAGMKCAGCVATVEKRLLACAEVKAASVNLLTERATVIYGGESLAEDFAPQLIEAIAKAGFAAEFIDKGDRHSARKPVSPKSNSWLGISKEIAIPASLVILAIVGHLGLIGGIDLPLIGNMYAHWLVSSVALGWIGRPIWWDGLKSLWYRAPNMNSLV